MYDNLIVYDKIKTYYIDGYGFPKKYYNDTDLDRFVAHNLITREEADEIKAIKRQEN